MLDPDTFTRVLIYSDAVPEPVAHRPVTSLWGESESRCGASGFTHRTLIWKHAGRFARLCQRCWRSDA